MLFFQNCFFRKKKTKKEYKNWDDFGTVLVLCLKRNLEMTHQHHSAQPCSLCSYNQRTYMELSCNFNIYKVTISCAIEIIFTLENMKKKKWERKRKRKKKMKRMKKMKKHNSLEPTFSHTFWELSVLELSLSESQDHASRIQK